MKSQLWKIGLLITVALSAAWCIASCSFETESPVSIPTEIDPSGVEIKGVYVLEPSQTTLSAGLDISAVPETKKIVFCVYDVENTTNANWDSVRPSCTLEFPSGNKYNAESIGGLPRQIRTFLENDGYDDATRTVSINVGAAPSRNVAVFLVSRTDLVSEESGTLTVTYEKYAMGTSEVNQSMRESIALPDGIFAAEENSVGYQLTRSVFVRASLVESLYTQALTSINLNNPTAAKVGIASAQAFFAESTPWGISLATTTNATLFSSELPPFSTETISSFDPEVGGLAVNLRDNLLNLSSALEAEDYATMSNYAANLESTLTGLGAL